MMGIEQLIYPSRWLMMVEGLGSANVNALSIAGRMKEAN
jgi:uncharacterized protein YjeT (DUF2065 family)